MGVADEFNAIMDEAAASVGASPETLTRRLVERWAETLALATLAAVMFGCATPEPPPPSAVCEALEPILPTYSTEDTERTKREVHRFREAWVLPEVCGS